MKVSLVRLVTVIGTAMVITSLLLGVLLARNEINGMTPSSAKASMLAKDHK
jgi:hypothetical protein